MWNALRSDLKEFVSTVTEDTSQVLSKIDESFPVLSSDRGGTATLSPEEHEAQRRMKLDETYTSPLVFISVADDDDDDPKSAALRADLEDFVTNFEVTDDLRKDLDDFPDLRDAYERLVPEIVPERDFWMRYAYRCDADRIAAEWDSDNEDDDDDDNKPGAAAVAQSLSSVTQFFGGAVKSVAASLKEADVQGGDGAEDGIAPARTTTASSFFGVGGARPPFVMNTAVDEDDDDDVPVEEEDEEELGWDDEDDDEDDDGKAGEDDEHQQDSTQEEIEFRDAATEQLQEQLKQALEERDQLHETVAMQSKKIVDLMAQVEAAPDAAADAGPEAVEALKLQLFETQSELAAVKERLLASQIFDEPPTPKEGSSASATPDDELQKRSEELQAKLIESETICSSLRAQVSELEEACQVLRSEKDASAAQVSSLQSVVEAMEQDKSRAEANALEAAELQDSVIRELQTKLDLAERRVTELEQGLADATRSASAASPETHESSVSCVKVDAPTSMEHAAAVVAPAGAAQPSPSLSLGATHAPESPVIAAPPPVVEREEGGEEGSDWGDDW